VNPQSSVYNLVQQYMALEQVEINRLQASKEEIENQQSSLTELSSQFRDLRSEANKFRWGGISSPINTFGASSGDTSIVTVSADATAAEGTHTVSVQSLATAHSIASAQFAGEEAFSLVGDYVFEIVQGEETYEVSVTIDEGSSNYDAMRAVVLAINASGADVTASLAAIDARTDSYRLLLSSKTSGMEGLIGQIADTSGNLTAVLGLAGFSEEGNYSANTLQGAANTNFTIDGLEFVSYSNHISDALTGITLDLNGVSEATVTLSIERDVEAIQESVQEFLEAYNNTLNYVRNLTSGADASGEGRGALTGDTMYMTLRRQLRRYVTAEVPDPTGQSDLVRLAQMGITTDREGRLSISDSSAFEDALRMKPDEVERLFSDQDHGIGVRMVELMDLYVGAGGLISQQRSLVQSRGRTLDQRIAREETYLEKREEQLTTKLAVLQQMMTDLQTQQQIMNAYMYR
ncbi:MAG: flagellar filament capping protein FliD, partial [Candidatus Eisenbacteria sp.]|nr:flagellar filament capping protein FliD [Candidatus Eisenbacteria bacterium]